MVNDLLRRHPGDKVSFMAFQPRQLPTGQRNASFLRHLEFLCNTYHVELYSWCCQVALTVLSQKTGRYRSTVWGHCMEHSTAARPEFGKIWRKLVKLRSNVVTLHARSWSRLSSSRSPLGAVDSARPGCDRVSHRTNDETTDEKNQSAFSIRIAVKVVFLLSAGMRKTCQNAKRTRPAQVFSRLWPRSAGDEARRGTRIFSAAPRFIPRWPCSGLFPSRRKSSFKIIDPDLDLAMISVTCIRRQAGRPPRSPLPRRWKQCRSLCACGCEDLDLWSGSESRDR